MTNNNSINLIDRTDTLLQKYIDSPSVRKFNKSEEQRSLLAAIALELLDQNTANTDVSKTSLDTATVSQFTLSNESLAYLQLNCDAIFHVNTKNASQLAALWKSNHNDNKFQENMALLRTMINASEHIDDFTLLTIFHDIGLTPQSAIWNYNEEPTELCSLLCQERSTSLDAFYKQTPPGLIVEMSPHLLPVKTMVKVAEVVAKPPYGYGHDTCIAKLHIGAKLENPSYPLLSVDARALRKSLSEGSEILNLIAEHKYKKFSELEGFSATEKLLLLYLAKYELMSQVLGQEKWIDNDNEKYVTNLYSEKDSKTARVNLDALLEDLLKSETVDLLKLNLLLHALVFFSEDGASNPPEDLWEMLCTITEKTTAECIPLFHQTAEKHGFLVSSFMSRGEAKVTTEESKMFVPILTRTGLFGANTFLSLFFNDLIPYCCSIRQFTGHELSVHDNKRKGHLNVLEHDIEHARRTIPITRNKPWHDYLKYCYGQILENPQLAGQENLLFYLFMITHELGMMPDQAAKFHEIIDARINRNNRVEWDDSFIEMLKQVANPDIPFEAGNERDWVVKCLDDLHNSFDKHFRISQINDSTDINALVADLKETNNLAPQHTAP